MAKLFIATLFLLASAPAFTQKTENGGWLFLSHTQTISKHFDVLADAQIRSSDAYQYLSTLLLRTALSYNFNKQHSAAFGYAYKGDWEKEMGDKTYMREHRIYEQYLGNFKLKKTALQLRARLEQRFVKEDKVLFSQRARAFVSVQFPLLANKDFTKGLYGNIQNELFVNVQHKARVNNHFFDQNRPFISAGYRWSKHLDTEAGYMPWLQRETSGNITRHIVQVMITTSL